MKYGIYKSRHNNKVLVSRDLTGHKALYYLTFLRNFETIQQRISQKELVKWLKKHKFKYIGGAV